MDSKGAPQKIAYTTKKAAQPAAATTTGAAPADEGKKLTSTGIMASAAVGLVAGVAAFMLGLSLSMSVIVFIFVVLLLLAFLTGSITLGSLMSDETVEEENPEEDAEHLHPHDYGEE